MINLDTAESLWFVAFTLGSATTLLVWIVVDYARKTVRAPLDKTKILW